MVGEDAPGGQYRLVLVREGRRIVHPTILPLYRRALTQVAEAVREHAVDGRPTTVVLEHRASPAGNTNGTSGASWSAVEIWGPEVVARIVRQNGHHRPAAAQSAAPSVQPRSVSRPWQTRAAPPRDGFVHPRPRAALDRLAPAQPRTAGPAVVPQPGNRPLPAEPPRGHRWHFGAGLAVVVFAWIAIALVLTGGRILGVLDRPPSSQPIVAKELPFTGPPPAPGRPPTSHPATSHPASQIRRSGF